MIQRLESLCLLAAGAFVILTGSAPVSAQTPAGPQLRATLTTDQQSYFIGEDIPVRYCLENISQTPLEFGIGLGKERFKPMVSDNNGDAMSQIPHFTPDEMGFRQRLSPGESWCTNHQLLEYARIDQAGTYSVRAALEFQSPRQLAPEAATNLTLRMPTESDAEHILTELERKPLDFLGIPGDFYRGVTVRPMVFLGPLRKRAENGNLYAIRAIGEMRISSIYRKADEFWLLNACGNALYSLGSRMEMMDIAVNRLADPATPPQFIDDFLSVLYGVFEGTTGGGGHIPTPAQGQVLSVRWRTFLTAHRSDIEAGKRWSLEDPEVTTDLVPPGWSLSRTGKPDWPAR